MADVSAIPILFMTRCSIFLLALVSLFSQAPAEGAPSLIQFRSASYQAVENQPFTLVELYRTGPLDAATVTCLVTNGTAANDVDFIPFLTDIPFSSGQASATLAIPLLDDSLDELNETVLLQLMFPSSPSLLGPRSNATLTILDNDRAGSIRVGAPLIKIREDAGELLIPVIRSGGRAGGVTVDFSVTGTTATDGADFQGGTGTLVFDEGVMTNLISVLIENDDLPEPDELFQIRLSQPTGRATIGQPGTTRVTLVDDDVGFMLSSATYLVSERSSHAVITVVRTGSLAEEISVDYATIDGTAWAGSDFEGLTNTLVFPRGVRKKFIRVPIVRDTDDEQNETFGIELSNPFPAEAVLGEPVTAQVTIVDNDTGGVIRFSSSVYTSNERAENAAITVVRTKGGAGGVTVDFTVVPITASPDEDYLAQTGRVTFGPGERKQIINLPLVHDIVLESQETVQLSLFNVTGGAVLGVPSNALLRIQNYTRPEGYAPTSLVGGVLEFIVENGAGILSDSGDYEFRVEGTNRYRILGSGIETNLVGGVTNVIQQTNEVRLTNNTTGVVTTTNVVTSVTNVVGATNDISGIGNESGTFFYRRPSHNIAELLLSATDSVRRQILTMTTTRGGTFYTTVSAPSSATNSFQVGTFEIISLPNFNTNAPPGNSIPPPNNLP